MAKWGIPEKSIKNVAQRRWPFVRRTLQSKVMAKLDLLFFPLCVLHYKPEKWNRTIFPLSDIVFKNCPTIRTLSPTKKQPSLFVYSKKCKNETVYSTQSSFILSCHQCLPVVPNGGVWTGVDWDAQGCKDPDDCHCKYFSLNSTLLNLPTYAGQKFERCLPIVKPLLKDRCLGNSWDKSLRGQTQVLQNVK